MEKSQLIMKEHILETDTLDTFVDLLGTFDFATR